PGISSYEHNPGALAKPLDECLNKVKERIPVHQHKSTSVYLGATAGMRLLRNQEDCAFNGIHQPKVKGNFVVGNSSIAWSLGYMLILTNMIPAEGKLIHLPLKPSLFAGLLIFLAVLALLCLFFLVYLCIVSRKQKVISRVEYVLTPELKDLTED
ncbi:UNVERIFIED_CONTAM: hypothetical protein H355_006407, partial [Colinus virginianus]